jgi:hypothetical protein
MVGKVPLRRVCIRARQLSPVTIIPVVLHTDVSFICHRRYVIYTYIVLAIDMGFVSKAFSFLSSALHMLLCIQNEFVCVLPVTEKLQSYGILWRWRCGLWVYRLYKTAAVSLIFLLLFVRAQGMCPRCTSACRLLVLR